MDIFDILWSHYILIKKISKDDESAWISSYFKYQRTKPTRKKIQYVSFIVCADAMPCKVYNMRKSILLW
jgi:hypothetical protein